MSQHKCVIAVDIHPRQTTLAITELSGRIAWQSILSLPLDPKKALNRLTAAIQDAVAANASRNIEGIGICLPGRTDANATRSSSSRPTCAGPSSACKLEDRARDRSAGQDGQRRQRLRPLRSLVLRERQVQDLVVVEVSEGLGTGIFVNGAIVRGEGGMAGEFGHIQMAENGVQCNCGNRGCWETLASNQAAVRYFEQSGSARKDLTFSSILKLALAHDPCALAALTQMAVCLGRGARMIAAALAPAEIVIVGEITAAWHEIGPTVEAELRKHSLGRKVRLRPAYDGASARLRSAVALVFADTFPQS